MLAATGEVEFAAVVGAPQRLDKLPRKTRLRTFTGKKKPAYFGWIQRW